MRGKRSKQYRKLMQQYGLSFGFREPYQVLLDADIIRDADRFKMDLIGGLERTLNGKVKPMITQCSMRHLYGSATEPGMSYVIEKAKSYERRRCGHLPSEYPVPLSTQLCMASVVDPKNSGNNRHRYIIASQDLDVRKSMRELMGVPLIYIHRSVMIMEPMAGKTAENRERGELVKLRSGVRRGNGILKRKRSDLHADEDLKNGDNGQISTKKRLARGPKGPNPLSVKKPKSSSKNEAGLKETKVDQDPPLSSETKTTPIEASEVLLKRRKRKHKPVGNGKGPMIVSADQ
ncbi:rRNA-processing protein utp23 [Golovinomyces cichoracearum]|uniref:U three protein 23 n=1 Tax=Golovinomyces cichoracearum TaxID=62708 RepID=A0A420IEY9_9PEZI|nr:rRNA-processing protein utp23 [Golovinomyces cichoracearum]